MAPTVGASKCIHDVSCLPSYTVGVAVFFFQAEDGIRDLVRSRGLGDVYKRQVTEFANHRLQGAQDRLKVSRVVPPASDRRCIDRFCLLYTSDAADERSSVDLGGRRIIKKKKKHADRGGHRSDQ